MVQKSSTQLKFNEAWTFPESVEKHISKFVMEHPGRWLHAPVGTSKIHKKENLGSSVIMTTLDINPNLNPDIVCDIFRMTEHPEIKCVMEKYGGYDGVISDPIWYEKVNCSNCGHCFKNPKGLAYPERRYLLYQLRDILKPGGWMLFNALWQPKCKGMKIIKRYEIAQAFASFRNSSLLYYSQKVNQELIL